MPEAVIVACARSPIGRSFKGSLRDMRPDDVALQIIRAALAQVPELDPLEIEDIVAGYTQPAGETDYNVARNLAVELGWDSVPGTTVTRYCSSSLQAARMAMHAIKAGEGDVFLSVGLESVSQHAVAFPERLPDMRHPMFLPLDARTAEQAATGQKWTDPRAGGGLPDLFIGMGHTAENVAQLMGITRQEQDEFAFASQQRAAAAIERGFFANDITPVTLTDGTVLTADDGPRPNTTLEGLAALKPAFWPEGTVTAGNSCPVNDGASALVIMSDTRAAELGITPLARIVASAATGLSPEIMGLGPVEASRLALRRAGLTIDDIDLVEINEAFAAQVIGSARELRIPHEKLNVNGGGIALGHNFGATGGRIMTTLLHNLAERDARYGLETMCVGGGQGMAMVVERL